MSKDKGNEYIIKTKFSTSHMIDEWYSTFFLSDCLQEMCLDKPLTAVLDIKGKSKYD